MSTVGWFALLRVSELVKSDAGPHTGMRINDVKKMLSLLQSASPKQLFQYIGYMSMSGKAPSTVPQHISAISRAHKLRSLTDPTDNFIIRRMLLGMKRESQVPDSRLPISLPMLSKMASALSFVCNSDY